MSIHMIILRDVAAVDVDQPLGDGLRVLVITDRPGSTIHSTSVRSSRATPYLVPKRPNFVLFCCGAPVRRRRYGNGRQTPCD